MSFDQGKAFDKVNNLYLFNTLRQGYSIRNPKGPLAKFPFSPGSGTVTVSKSKNIPPTKTFKLPYAQKVMWSGLICVKGDTFLWFKFGHKRCDGQAEALM